MGIFGKSFNREIGKNTGKWISNKVFGDGHSTPHRVKITRENAKLKEKEREALEVENEKKRRHQKELAEIRSISKKPTSVRKAEIEAASRQQELTEERRIAELKAEAAKSDEVRLKELEIEEKKRKSDSRIAAMTLSFPVILILVISFFVYRFFSSRPPCDSVQECLSMNEFEVAKSHLSGDWDHGEATNIVHAEVSHLSSLGQYKEAYNALAFLKGYDFSSIYAEEKAPAVDKCIQTIVEEAILNDQTAEARKYAKFHSDPNSLENLFQ